MACELISSPANPLLKRIRKLRRRKQRESERALFVEGIAPVWQAIDSGAEIEVVVTAPDLLKSERARAVVEPRDPVHLSAEAFASIADRDHPSGLGAIVRIPDRDLSDVGSGLVVALHEVGNPGNLGTVVRTADAAGAAGVVVTGAATDPWDPGAVKASLGTVFSTPVVGAGIDEVLALGLPVIATSARGRVAHWEMDYPERCVLLFGSEATGLPDELLDRAAEVVRIPQRGAASSLNLAVAAGIVIYEAAKTRLR